MQIRNPVVAGTFYPYDPEELKRVIENFMEKVDVKRKTVLGVVSPHAGYIYCGKTAALIYKMISTGFDTVVLIGPNHSGLGVGVATSFGSWKTPLGSVKSDDEFVNEIIKDSLILEDFKSHSREHSIEVQLPWLQYRFQDFKIVPITINPIYFDVKTCQEIGIKIADVAKKLYRKVLVVASSDFTHYGSMYGYQPFKGIPPQIIKKIKEMDMEVINQIEKLNPEEMIRICDEKRLTICGYGGIAAMLFAAKALGATKGELIDYSTSFDVSKNTDAIVGYAGMAIY